MNVSATCTTQAAQLIGLLNSGMSSMPEGGLSSLGKGQSEIVDISGMGNERNWIEGLDDDTMAEMEAFRQEMLDAIQSGSFDAAEMAEKAPQAMKDHAEEAGIDLEQMLGEMAERMEDGKRPPPPALQGYNAQGMGISATNESDVQSSLVESLLASLTGEDQ